MRIPTATLVLLLGTGLGIAGAESGASAEGTHSHPGGIPETCPEVLHASGGGLSKTTDPPGGAAVHPGQTVTVTLRWDRHDFPDAHLHKALDCVTLDGRLLEAQSVLERDTANDGVFEYSYTVPEAARAGSALCDRGFVSGPSSGRDGAFRREPSDLVCQHVEPAAAVIAPGPTTPMAPPPVVVVPVGVPASPPEVTLPERGEAPIEVLPATLTRPRQAEAAPPRSSVLSERARLPQSGGDPSPLLALSGLALTTGGACVTAASSRSLRRACGPRRR